MHFVYGYCYDNSKAALIEYARRFPSREIPRPRVFTNLHNHLRETGYFNKRKRDGFDGIDVHTEENIIESVQLCLGTSIRRLSN